MPNGSGRPFLLTRRRLLRVSRISLVGVFAGALHASRHELGGVDALSPTLDVGGPVAGDAIRYFVTLGGVAEAFPSLIIGSRGLNFYQGGASSVLVGTFGTLLGNLLIDSSADLYLTVGGGLFDFILNCNEGQIVSTKLSFFGIAPVVRQVSAADLTNNVTAGGVNDTIATYADLIVYANDAAAIRNDIYQLARKLKQINDGLRAYGLFT